MNSCYYETFFDPTSNDKIIRYRFSDGEYKDLIFASNGSVKIYISKNRTTRNAYINNEPKVTGIVTTAHIEYLKSIA